VKVNTNSDLLLLQEHYQADGNTFSTKNKKTKNRWMASGDTVGIIS
jgi:hypothetical protein